MKYIKKETVKVYLAVSYYKRIIRNLTNTNMK